jgi:hypothetical protein
MHTSCWGTSWPTLKCVKMFFGFGYPRACRFRKTKQTNQIWFLVWLNFFKTWFLLHKMWLKLAKIVQKWNFSIFLKNLNFLRNRTKTVSNVFHDLKNVKIAAKSLKIGQFLPILATFYEFKSRFEKNQSNQEPYLICFRNLQALGYPKPKTILKFTHFRVNSSLSMMWM